MNNNSSLMKLSSTILHKKYTDLIFENNNKYDVDIRKDLTRTFPDNILFKYGNNYYNKLYHIIFLQPIQTSIKISVIFKALIS